MGTLNLGSVEFEGFELPSQISFGGRQRLAVHSLIGGARIIDVLGRDDAVIAWSGVLCGPNAAERARTLDAMRVAGLLVPLSWNAFSYAVIVSQLDLSFKNPWWILYKVHCVVSQDGQFSLEGGEPSPLALIAADLAAAGTLLGPSETDYLASAIPSSNVNAQTFSIAATKVQAVQSSLAVSLKNAENTLPSRNLNDLVTATGAIATLSCANGYLSRSLVNIATQGAS